MIKGQSTCSTRVKITAFDVGRFDSGVTQRLGDEFVVVGTQTDDDASSFTTVTLLRALTTYHSRLPVMRSNDSSCQDLRL